jgi:RimJ/RimL family protein N-acetyltransferase
MHAQLFEGPILRLSAVDPEKDGAVEASWTYDLDYTRNAGFGQNRPLGAIELKKHYESLAKKAGEGDQFFFAVRVKEDDQLIGFIRIPSIFWTHAAAIFTLSFADSQVLQRHGSEALELTLRFAFRELNLYRLETVLPSCNQEAIDLVEQAGFLMEVRRRQAWYSAGRAWDLLHFGILQAEWISREEEAVAL